MPQEEEQGWAQQGQEEAGGAWSSILAPALEVLVPGAGRASWVSGRARGAQGDDGDGGEDFEVESQMLEPLTEGGGRKAKGGFKLRGAGRLRAGVKRNRNLAALGGAAAVLLLAGIWYSNTMSGYGEASALCASLTHDETGSNDIGEWTPWAAAVSKVFLRHRVPPVNTDQAAAATACAKRGWPEECTSRVFSEHGGSAESLPSIERDRRTLETEYTQAVVGVRPMDQELRIPAAVGLRYREKAAAAALHVCEIPPQDARCIVARKEEVEAVTVLRSELSEAVQRMSGDGITQLDGGIHDGGGGGSTAVLLNKIAELVHEQKAPAVISQNTWRTLNAVTAVVLHETLEDVEGRAGTFLDVLLHPGTGLIAFVGSFRGLKYEGRGVMFYKDGSVVYAGDFEEGLFHGKGVLKRQDGTVVWKGAFSQGQPLRSLV